MAGRTDAKSIALRAIARLVSGRFCTVQKYQCATPGSAANTSTTHPSTRPSAAVKETMRRRAAALPGRNATVTVCIRSAALDSGFSMPRAYRWTGRKTVGSGVSARNMEVTTVDAWISNPLAESGIV